MLETMYQAFCEHTQDPVTAWDRFVEFIAADNRPTLFYQINHRFEWLFENSELVRKVEQTYLPILMRSDHYDHLGEMYIEHVLSPDEAKAKGIKLTPHGLAQLTARETIGEDERPLYIVDPAAGTGRLLMAVHEYAPKAHLLGVESDLRLLRIALTNLAIHRIHACLLHADSHTHEIDLRREEGRFNWNYANHWYSCMDKLKPVSAHSTLKPKNNDLR